MCATAKIDLNVISRRGMKTDIMISWVALISFVGLVFLGLYQLRSPAPMPASAPQTVFSAERASRHVSAIAQTPHPMGSEANSKVRDYIVQELTRLGLKPEIQETIAISKYYYYRAGYPQNIVARIPGTDPTKAVLLVAHYDSVPFAPGVNDDATAVAAILETLRALQMGLQLENDVIVLFTDGEEGGTIGAKAFAESHPWVQDVGIVLNFEASGFYGPSLMFETSDENGWLIREFAAAAPPYPIANSFMQDIYNTMIQTTDFTVLEEVGLLGLNFAYVNGSTHNHTPLDNLDHVNLPGLQHHGSYALALTRHFGNLDLNYPKEGNAAFEGDAVFFTIFSILVHYPEIAVIPLTILAALSFLGIVIIGFRRKRLQFSGVGLGFLGLILTMLIATGIVYLLWLLIRALHSEYRTMFWDIYNGNFYLIAFSAFAIAITSAIYSMLRKKVNVPNLLTGSLFGWLIVLVVITFYFPGATYLFLWPLLAHLLLLAFQLTDRWQHLSLPKRFIALILPVALTMLLFTPMIYLMFVVLTWSSSASIVASIVFMCGSFIPLFDMIAISNKRLFPVMLALVGIGFVVGGSLTAGFDVQHPRANTLSYGLDADSGKAFWISIDNDLDEWTSQVFTTNVKRRSHSDVFFPWSTTPVTLGDAPAITLPAPEIELLDDRIDGNNRILDMRVRSFRQAALVTLCIDSTFDVRAATVDGKRFENQAESGEDWVLFFYSPPEDGFGLTVEVPTSHKTVEIRATDRTYGLPELPILKPRPDYMMPMVFGYSDTTFVGKLFSFKMKP